jgi:hypothetical protein
MFRMRGGRTGGSLELAIKSNREWEKGGILGFMYDDGDIKGF